MAAKAREIPFIYPSSPSYFNPRKNEMICRMSDPRKRKETERRTPTQLAPIGGGGNFPASVATRKSITARSHFSRENSYNILFACSPFGVQQCIPLPPTSSWSCVLFWLPKKPYLLSPGLNHTVSSPRSV
jgi:hypothetical protein